MKKDFVAVLFSEEEIAAKVSEIARKINYFYGQQQDVKEVVVVGILRGAVVFLSDLIRQLDLPVTIDFMDVSSYGNDTKSSGAVRIMKDLSSDISGKDVLIVEDIVDSGLTLKYLSNVLWSRKPKSLQICTFLNKPSRRSAPLEPDFYGFNISDEFVVGYGLDYAGRYRELPYVAILAPEVYNK